MDSELIAWRAEAGRFVDVQLMAELRRFVRADRRCEARILVFLAEMDERELYLARGYSSLFRYVVSVLRLSEAQAYLRICPARVARRYPVALQMLMDGALNLSTVKVLAPHLTAANCAMLFDRARDKTKREVEFLIAEIAPKPDVPTRVRKLPGRRARKGSAQVELVMTPAPLDQRSSAAHASVDTAGHAGVSPDARETSGAADIAAALVPHAAAASVSPGPADAVASRGAAAFALEAPRASCAALSPGRYRLELTVDQSLFDQMMALKHLLKHRVPSGDLGAILGLAIAEVSDRLRKQRFAELSRPASGARARASRNEAPAPQRADSAAPQSRAHRAPSASIACDFPNEGSAQSSACASHEASTAAARSSKRGNRAQNGSFKIKGFSRYVPRAVVREVFARDGAQCTFVSADGTRCAECEMLELHHVKAFAHGGAPTPENLKVVCRAHNGYFATLDFGAAHMRMMRVRAR